ncbi:MAG: hypothetical protein OXU61_06400 [Gammaproteobacteria bacterium]|nr:hypothetical protein [Gammaproteobacteria bacterium]
MRAALRVTGGYAPSFIELPLCDTVRSGGISGGILDFYEPKLWEQILVGGLAVLVVMWFWPGIRQAVRESQEAENPDWRSALLAIGAVAAFVALLIFLAAG